MPTARFTPSASAVCCWPSISGPAGEGLRYSDGASAVNLDSAKAVVEKFRAEKYEPEGYTLNSYAAIQAWAAAANEAKTTDSEKVAATLRSHPFKTAIGDLGFNSKGDITRPDYVMYKWSKGSDGKYNYAEIGK